MLYYMFKIYRVVLNIDLTHNPTALHHKTPLRIPRNLGVLETQIINWKRNIF
jgi:hypothetical protein